jgi:hypothetical protein
MIGFERRTATGRIPVFGPNAETATGGYLLVMAGLTKDTVLVAGTPLVLDDVNRTATVLHTAVAKANAGGAATTYQVAKGHTFQVGDYMASGATGGKAYAITAIDTSNSAYDTLTVGTSIGAVTAGDLLFASTATGATSSALAGANGLLYEETVARVGTSVSAVIRGTAYARRIPVNAAIMALPGLRFILFSQSR